MTNGEAAAILESEAEYLYSQDEPYNREAFNMAIEALQERKTGKWFLDKALNYRCSVCNRITTDISVTKPPFCQWCGAKMKVGE